MLAPAMEDDNQALVALLDVLVPAFADWAAIDVVGEAGTVVRIGGRHSRVDTPDWSSLAERFPRWDAPVRRAMTTGASSLSFDVVADAERAPAEDHDHIEIARAMELVSCAIVPVRVRGLSLAAITLATGAERRGYRPSDLQTAEQLAARAAAALERGMLYREARSAAERADRNASRLARLVEAALAFASAPTPSDVLGAVAEQARRVFGAASAVAVVQIDTIEMRRSAPDDVAQPDERQLATVMATNRPTRRPDADWMAVPLMGPDGANRGAVFLSGERREDDVQLFGPDDEALAVLLGQLASLALESARRYDAVRRSQQQLQQSQRMEAMGRLAGGLAHDFGNLLTVILGYSEFLLRAAGPGHPLHDDLLAIQQAGERATTLTEQLLTISSRRVVEPVVVDVADVVIELEAILRRLIGEDIDLVTRTPGQPACVRADHGQLEQIVLNLVINARHALPEGGTVELAVDEVEVVDADRKYDAIRLSVRDDGVGMDEDTLEHCFEPFFSTRERAKGTGLGLATVYGIVHQAGGTITAESALGRGTTFRVVIPKVVGGAPARVPEVRQPVPSGSETILLVEDEPEVRELARDVLERSGYRVLTAEGAAALAMIRDGEHDIDLLVTDVVMPDMGGFALAEAALKDCPDLEVLYISGYADDGGREWPDAWHFLAKPFRPDQLSAKVRFVLDSRRD